MNFDFALAQLRHFYKQLKSGDVHKIEMAADGLLAPSIECFEHYQRKVNEYKDEILNLHRIIALQKEEIQNLKKDLNSKKLSSDLYYQWKSGDPNG